MTNPYPALAAFLKRPAMIVWKMYCFLYFRAMIFGHWLKGDIPFLKMFWIMFPPRFRPKEFDYFRGLSRRAGSGGR